MGGKGNQSILKSILLKQITLGASYQRRTRGPSVDRKSSRRFARSLAPRIDCNLEKTGPALNQSPSINNNRQVRAICPPLPPLLCSYPPARDRVTAKRRASERAPRRASVTAIIDNYTRGNYAGAGARRADPACVGLRSNSIRWSTSQYGVCV